MSYSYTAPASGPVVVTATIGTSATDDVPANNTATASTGIGATDVLTSVGVPATATAGSTVSGSFAFGNAGAGAAAGLTYSATIGSAGNYPAAVAFTNLPTGVTAVYSNATGQVTFTGMPTTLASGQSLYFAFEYAAPGSGTVPVATSIATSSTDANPANNAATGTTAITPPPVADMAVALTGFPASASPGATVTGTVTCTAGGTTASLNATCAASGLPAGATVDCVPTSPQSSLASGAAIACSVSFTAPASGTVNVGGSTGATNDANPANNTAGTAVKIVDAVNDPTATVGSGGGTVTVLGNDTVGGAPPVIGVDIGLPTIPNNGGLTGLTVDGSGQLDVPPGATPGSHTVTYQICALAPATACDTATVTITITAGRTEAQPIPAVESWNLALLAALLLLAGQAQLRRGRNRR